MADERKKIPFDAQLLGDAIIELNISRRNVSVYPKDHPSVEKSLSRAFDLLQKLLELRPEITLAIAKDILIVDDYYLDKKNPVYREFALTLNRMNIAYITFLSGLRKDELYDFHLLISENFKDLSESTFQERFKERNFVHIKAGFIDYGLFSFKDGKTVTPPYVHLWERYIYKLFTGTETGDISDEMCEIPPRILAGLMNRTTTNNNFREESYEKIITTYVRRSSERAFSGGELKKLMAFINELRPELKKQFLSSTVRTISKDIKLTEKALKELSIEEVIRFLDTINEQKLAIPEALKNLLNKLSRLRRDGIETPVFEGSLVVDDISLPSAMFDLFDKDISEVFVNETYQKEIKRLLEYDTSEIIAEFDELKRECTDDYIDKDFNLIILELLTSDSVSEEEYKHFIATIKEQLEQIIWTGQYRLVLRTLRVLEQNAEENIFPELTSEALQYCYSPGFISKLVDSLRILGRRMREEAVALCDHYGDRIISPLMDALIEEDSQAIRRFLIDLIKHFGDRTIPEAVKRLGDGRWFVKRNMLYILSGCNNSEIIPHVRPYCYHENRKVSLEAIKCLLNAKDSYGVEALRDSLRSDSREIVKQAIALSGAFKVKEVVADLTQMLRKRGVTGTDLNDKISIVRALGDIRDPRALDILRDILSERSILFRKALEELKEEIYSTLKNYPYRDIQDLIEAGLKSKNQYIREESLRLKKA
ncbi:MAG: HEAT repeat domain-containing protein [Nitrospirota bacterium]